MGHTRAVRLGDWKYIAWRFEEDVLRRLPSGYEQEGLYTRIPGDFSAGMIRDSVERQPAYYKADQLYYIADDPEEMHNLAENPAYADRLLEMQSLLARMLKPLRGSFGDFKYETEIRGAEVVHPVTLDGDLDLSAPYNVISVAETSRLTEPAYVLITYTGDCRGTFEDTSRVEAVGYEVAYSKPGQIRIVRKSN